MEKSIGLALSLPARLAGGPKGFTLIELMVVIAIIGLVASLGFGSYQTSLKRGRDAQRKGDLQQIRSALEIYRADWSVYPSTGGTYQIQGGGNPCGSSSCTWGNAWTCGSPSSTYMERLSDDPKSPNVNYHYSSNGTTYTLEACLENSNDPNGVTPTLGWGTGCASNKVFQVKNP